jgi:hypothetical protein
MLVVRSHALMTKPWKRQAAVSLIAIAVASTAYLLTLGHFFLPFGATAFYEKEKLDTWEYTTYPLAIQPKPADLTDALKRAAWKIARPGQVCLLATAERLQAAAPNQDHSLQEVLEAMGYKFPPGCHATTVEIVPCWRITHYPSMLRRIAKDLHFRVTWRAPAEPAGDERPNPAVQRTGASRSAGETNQRPVVAGSGR